MKIKIQPRQSGKTFDIAKRMKKERSSAVIVPTMMMKKLFCKTYKFSKLRVFTMSEFIQKQRNFKKVYIDEIGCCLGIIIPNVIYATHTDF